MAGFSFGVPPPAAGGSVAASSSSNTNSSSFGATPTPTQNQTENQNQSSSNQEGSNSSSSKVRAMAWDPKSPHMLTLPSYNHNNTAAASKLQIQVKALPCTTGLGCNAEETSALLQLLQAREDANTELNSLEQDASHNSSKKNSYLQTLSANYRQCLHHCLQAWEERLFQQQQQQDDTTSTTMQDNTNNKEHGNENETINKKKNKKEEEEQMDLELLKVMLSLLDLSEVVLLPPPNSKSQPSLAGAWTANLIRYLRYNHLASPDHFCDGWSLQTEEDVNDMLSSDQPEYWGGYEEEEEEEQVHMVQEGHEEEEKSLRYSAYWQLVRRLVSRGLLRDAWAVLSRHSLCRSDGSPQDVQGFQHLRAMLLSAPLPGGRTDVGDDRLTPPPSSSKHYHHQQQESSLVKQPHADDYLQEGPLFLGIDPWGYEGWDDNNGSAAAAGAGGGGGLHAAQSHWNVWSTAVRDAAREDGTGLAGGLLRRIPQLRWAVLDVLAGEASMESFDGWPQALCTHLLYQHPSIRPGDVGVRVSSMMQTFELSKEEPTSNSLSSSSSSEEFMRTCYNPTVIAILKKNAGKALQALHSFGGGSGAALPVTMTALLCDLLVMANRVPKITHIHPTLPSTVDISDDNDGDDEASPATSVIKLNLRQELLLSAAWACEASFQSQEGNTNSSSNTNSEVGLRCAARLLRLEGSKRAVVALCDMICRRIPASDGETHWWLNLCTEAAQEQEAEQEKLNSQTRGTKRASAEGVLLREAGRTMSLARARYYLQDRRPGGAAFWMLRAADVEAPCRSHHGGRGVSAVGRLGALCAGAASALLQSLALESFYGRERTVEEKEGTDIHTSQAQEIVTAIQEDSALPRVFDDPAFPSSRSFALLRQCWQMALAMQEGRTKDAASCIIACLEEIPRTKPGSNEADHGTAAVVSHRLAQGHLWFPLLQIAFGILQEETQASGATSSSGTMMDKEGLSLSFTSSQITVLMCTYQSLEKSYESDVLYRHAGMDLVTGEPLWKAKKMTEEMDTTTASTLDVDNGFSMEKLKAVLCLALSQSFVVGNAQLQMDHVAQQRAKEEEEAILHAPPLVGGTKEGVLEPYVEVLLGPPMCKF